MPGRRWGWLPNGGVQWQHRNVVVSENTCLNSRIQHGALNVVEIAASRPVDLQGVDGALQRWSPLPLLRQALAGLSEPAAVALRGKRPRPASRPAARRPRPLLRLNLHIL